MRVVFDLPVEALAAVSVYTTYPGLFARRHVTHWVDNTVGAVANTLA